MSNLETQLGMISAVHNTQLFAWQLQEKALTKVQGACAPAQDQTLMDTFRKLHTSSSRASFPSVFTYWNLKHRREGWGWRDDLSRYHRKWDAFPEGRNVILGLGGGFLGPVWVCFAHQELAASMGVLVASGARAEGSGTPPALLCASPLCLSRGCPTLESSSRPWVLELATLVSPKKLNEGAGAAVLKAVQRGFGCSALIKRTGGKTGAKILLLTS